MMYTLIPKFAIISPKKHVVKIRKIEADSDSDRGETTLAQNCKNINCMLFILSCSSEIYVCIDVFGP